MTARRRSVARSRPLRGLSTALSDATRGKRSDTPSSATRWRRETRPRLLRSAVAATESLRWSPALLGLLLEELYADDGLAELLGTHVEALDTRQYPQAIALALLLRHSWRPDDLASILDRLKLPRAH